MALKTAWGNKEHTLLLAKFGGFSYSEFNGTQALYALFAGNILTCCVLKEEQGFPVRNQHSNLRIKNLFHEIKVP